MSNIAQFEYAGLTVLGKFDDIEKIQHDLANNQIGNREDISNVNEVVKEILYECFDPFIALGKAVDSLRNDSYKEFEFYLQLSLRLKPKEDDWPLKESFNSLCSVVIMHSGDYLQGIGEKYGQKSRESNSVVYFIKNDTTGNIKIGYSTDIKSRISDISNGSCSTLSLLGMTPGGVTKESELHNKFRKYRIKGEWFKPAPELLKYIASINI